MKLGLLGGTFDPVHNGHVVLAEKAHEELGLDKVIFIPAFIPPHKNAEGITAVEHRLKMLEISSQDLSFCEISDIELKKEQVVYTVDTLREMRAIYGEAAELYFLVGSDFVDQYTTWKDYTTLSSLATFMIAARPGFSVNHIPEGMQLLEGDFPLVSSSDLRIIIRNGENVSRYVPLAVCNYIKNNNLYSLS